MLKIKRIYDSPDDGDGFRVLVDRIWPRGISKARAHLDLWMRDIAPSNALRKWFAHDPEHWSEFVKKYHRELKRNAAMVQQVRALEKENGTLTLLYSAHDAACNQAVALRMFLKSARAK